MITHFLFFMLKIYPYWVVPTIVILAELAIAFKRKNKKILLFVTLGWGGGFAITLLLWLLLRGDLHSDAWVRNFLSL